MATNPTKLRKPALKSITKAVPIVRKHVPPPEPGNWETPKKMAAGFKKQTYLAPRRELLGGNFFDPVIFISFESFLRIYFMVDLIGLEVGWLGTVEECEGDEMYLIDNVHLFEQSVSLGHTDITAEDMSKFTFAMLEAEDGMDTINRLRFWGHSHVEGGTYPSHQDNEQMHLFGDNDAPYFIRGIFNRRGEVSFSFYDWEKGVAFHNVEWHVEPEKHWSKEQIRALQHQVEDEMRRKVTAKAPPPMPVARGVQQAVHYLYGAGAIAPATTAATPHQHGVAGVASQQPHVHSQPKPFDPFYWLEADRDDTEE